MTKFLQRGCFPTTDVNSNTYYLRKITNIGRVKIGLIAFKDTRGVQSNFVLFTWLGHDLAKWGKLHYLTITPGYESKTFFPQSRGNPSSSFKTVGMLP